MELMDAWEMLAIGVGALLLPLGATARYLITRLNTLEQDAKTLKASEAAEREEANTTLRAEVQVLRQRVADSEKREASTRAEMDVTRRDLDELQSSLKVALTEIAALREQVSSLERELALERDEKAKAEARVKELSSRVTELEATAARLTIERDTLERLIRDRMTPGEGGDGALAAKPSTKDTLAAAKAIRDEHERRHGARAEQPAQTVRDTDGQGQGG